MSTLHFSELALLYRFLTVSSPHRHAPQHCCSCFQVDCLALLICSMVPLVTQESTWLLVLQANCVLQLCLAPEWMLLEWQAPSSKPPCHLIIKLLFLESRCERGISLLKHGPHPTVRMNEPDRPHVPNCPPLAFPSCCFQQTFQFRALLY